jgi:hypothetical protein
LSQSPEDPTLEPHRPFVRELNRTIQTDYGMGGALALAAAALPPLIAHLIGALWQPAPWALALLTFLVGMLVVRGWLARRAPRRAAQLDAYCAINELSPAALQRYFEPGGLYPFLTTLKLSPLLTQ